MEIVAKIINFIVIGFLGVLIIAYLFWVVDYWREGTRREGFGDKGEGGIGTKFERKLRGEIDISAYNSFLGIVFNRFDFTLLNGYCSFDIKHTKKQSAEWAKVEKFIWGNCEKRKCSYPIVMLFVIQYCLADSVLREAHKDCWASKSLDRKGTDFFPTLDWAYTVKTTLFETAV